MDFTNLQSSGLLQVVDNKNCKQYVSEVTVKVFNSLQDKELHEKSIFLLTTLGLWFESALGSN